MYKFKEKKFININDLKAKLHKIKRIKKNLLKITHRKQLFLQKNST